MHVALRERDLDVVIAERLVDGFVKLVDELHPDVARRDEDAQLEVERTLAEAAEDRTRRGLAEDVLVGLRGLQQQLARELGVRAVGGRRREMTTRVIGSVKVQLMRREVTKLLVGHDHLATIEVDDRRRAHPDLLHEAVDVADGHEVTDADRAFEQDDDA